MDFGELGEAAMEGAVEGLASSVPLPPPPPGGPDVPPRPGADEVADEAGTPPSEAERRATVPVVLALGLTLLVGAGAFALVSWAGGGTGCDAGAFESVRYGYCVQAPGGWNAAAAEAEGTALDRFQMQDGAATITVIAVPLTQGQDLARFEQFVRGFDEDAGGRMGVSSALEVDGEEAVSFDVTLEGPDGVVRSREVLFTRDGIAWRVTLADDQVGFGSSVTRLEELLASWRFT